MTPLIVWLGSKYRQRGRLIPLITGHRKYIDPTFGGGSISVNKIRSKIEIFSDLDPRLINLYENVKKEGEEIANIIQMTEFDERTYLSAKKESGSEFDCAVKFLIKNRMSYLGLDRGFDPRLKEQWCRLPRKVRKWQKRLKGVTIECKDLFEHLKYIRKDTFLFIDPPYFQYQGYYQKDNINHENLLEQIKKSRGKIMITGPYDRFYHQKLQGWSCVKWKRRLMIECAWYNY